MGNARLTSYLARHRVLALDTSVFIYQLDAHPRYSVLTQAIFAWVEQPGHLAVTSTLTMTELLVAPYAEEGDEGVDEYYAALSFHANLLWVPPDLAIADLAARFRADHRLRTPDAILAATAAHQGAAGLITNDPAFQRVSAFETALLDAFLPRSGPATR